MTEGGHPHERLLGFLVDAGFGAGQLEVMATKAVAWMLGNQDVAEQFGVWLEQRAGVEVNAARLLYRAEGMVEGSRGRVDVAGYDGTRMRVALEAKFDASLGVEQLIDYARYAPDSVLGVIVPERRTEEAAGILQLADDELRDLNVEGLLLTWDEVADVLERAGAYPGDVEQFHSLCKTAGGLDVGYFSERDLGQERVHRLQDLYQICDRVTVKLHQRLVRGRVFPIQGEDQGFSGHRYVCPGRGQYCFAIGVRTWEAAPDAPVWMRWTNVHSDGGAEQVQDRLQKAGFDTTRDFGHVWVPLELPTNTDAGTLVALLVDQVLERDAAVRGLPWPQPPPQL